MPAVDSRRWTGPEPGLAPLNRRAARAAFLAAGGPGAAAPQRAASIVSWAGLALLLPVLLIGADQRLDRFGTAPLSAWLRGGLEARLSPSLGPEGAEGLATLLGDPRLLAALLALAGALSGTVLAWRHRAALARGFAAAEAGTPGAVFTTHRYGMVAPFLLLYTGWLPLEGGALLPKALALWLMARLASTAIISLAERRAAGLGAQAAAPSGWDPATLAVSLAALLLLLGHVLRMVG